MSVLRRNVALVIGGTVCALAATLPTGGESTDLGLLDWLCGPSRLRAAFSTVDPAGDTVQAMADYVSNFHPTIIGYTDSPDEIANAAKEIRVQYESVSTECAYTMNQIVGVFA